MRIDAVAGRVTLTLPMRGSRAAGLRLLRDHAAWATERLAALPPQALLADGGTVPVAGEPHVIRHRPGTPGSCIADGAIVVSGDAAFLARRVTDLLRAEARRRLAASAVVTCQAAGVTARRITVKDTKSRWGSCSPDGTLMFCWRLVMAPGWVQDYVVAHEVAHLRHMNHGRAFWALVAELSPHREAASQWLKANGAGLLRA